jgi:SAM-dependent MidA family methyltransferase
MEICLYDPELGYYNSNETIVGKDGDFYTSSTVSPVFGAVIGKQLEEMWGLMGEPAFTIVEYGAGTGALCRSILDHLKRNASMYEQLRYCIIERSSAMRDQEKQILHEKVEWFGSIKDIGKIQGCILSNELLDNFAVHRVVMQKELMEVYVNYENGFTEELKPASIELKNYLLELGTELPPGYQTEINLQALDWLREISAVLERGFVLTIDYGYLNSEMYKAWRNQGTLLCYYKHKVHDAFYENIGKQDLTAHVNFSALILWGAKSGLMECGFVDQFQFLISLGFRQTLIEMLSNEQDVVQASIKAAAISQTLLMDMGGKLKVLAQNKRMGEVKLSGFQVPSRG